MRGSRENQGLLSCTQFRPYGTGGAMLWILCLALCSLLTPTRADTGALLRLGMDVLNREVQNAMDESHILEKMAAEAGQNRPGMKPIKGITDLKVKDVLVPVITMNFMPGVGVFQCVSTGMTITGKSFMGGNMEIIVVLNITATNRLLQDEETGLPMFKSEGCEIILVSVKTNLPSNMLPKMVNKFLDSTLHKVLPGLMCPAIDAVLVYVNKKWASLNAPMPVGQMGTVQYVLTSVPTTTPSYIQVDFSIGELPPQTTVTLAGFIPKVAEAYPKPKPLVTQIRINKPPKVTMKTGKSLLHLHGTLEMFAARRRGKPPVSLFVLETHFNLKIQYSVHEDRLQMTTSLDRLLSMSRKSSLIGPFKEKKLTGFITDFLQEAYIPVINDVLQVGFPLPDLLDMNYNLAELDITENALVLNLKLD
ncbi:BPI fold-containing family B member 6 isoform X3 [Bos javanicus]|uniref:BPI fold-containing family B member 6 isoform X3 n=1 Tax=Bos javanicus TaxID=9906 RepID=UPI002AA87B90|nr:BPI fold-containing family B member 6 isoform X3 [Bos javanicus]